MAHANRYCLHLLDAGVYGPSLAPHVLGPILRDGALLLGGRVYRAFQGAL